MSEYENAGRFYGALTNALGFGELVMIERRDDFPAFMYMWSFTAAGKRLRAEYCITRQQLLSVESLEVLAKHVADRWKYELRGRNETNRTTEASDPTDGTDGGHY